MDLDSELLDQPEPGGPPKISVVTDSLMPVVQKPQGDVKELLKQRSARRSKIQKEVRNDISKKDNGLFL